MGKRCAAAANRDQGFCKRFGRWTVWGLLTKAKSAAAGAALRLQLGKMPVHSSMPLDILALEAPMAAD